MHNSNLIFQITCDPGLWKASWLISIFCITSSMHPLCPGALYDSFQRNNMEGAFQYLVTWFLNPFSFVRSCAVNTVHFWGTDDFSAPERMTPSRALMGKSMATPAPCVRPSCELSHGHCHCRVWKKTGLGWARERCHWRFSLGRRTWRLSLHWVWGSTIIKP